MTTKQVPAVQNLFTNTPDGPRLQGSKCIACNTPYFPKSPLCHNPQCDDGKMEDAFFGPHGRLWSFAIQNYPPPPPARYDEPYVPYAVGMIDLAEGLRVLGRILTENPDKLEVGADVELVLAPLAHEETGEALVSWQFKPVSTPKRREKA